MDVTIRLLNVFEGPETTLPGDVGKVVKANEDLGRVSDWTRLPQMEDLDIPPGFNLDMRELGIVRGPRYILAKVSNAAAKILKLHKGSGWYVTTLPPNRNYTVIESDLLVAAK